LNQGRTANTSNAPTNFPIITAANVTSNGTTVDGTLNVEPGAQGTITVFDQSEGGNFIGLFPLGETTFSAGNDGDATWHFTTSTVLQQRHKLVALQVHGSGSSGVTSEASDPFDPFAPQGGGGGGQVGGGGGGQVGGGGEGTQRACPVSPAAQPVQFQFGRGESPDFRYVDAAFQAGLGRRAFQAELTQFGNLLRSAQITRMQTARDVFESADSRFRQADLAYLQILGRHGSPAELQAAQAEATTAGELRMRAALLAGSELYDCSGGTNASWINQVYQDLLRRPADSAASAFYGGQLASGMSRAAVVSEILGTTEARDDVVKNLYTELLNRQPDNQTLNFYAGLLGNSTEEAVEARILSSPDFLAHIGTPAAFSTVTIRTNLITFDQLRAADDRMGVYQVVVGPPPRRAGDVTVATAERLRRVGIVRLGHHGKGRVRARWNRTVNGHRLRPGSYVILLQATDRHGRLLYQSDPIKLMLKR
jgi:hypothetical protein